MAIDPETAAGIGGGSGVIAGILAWFTGRDLRTDFKKLEDKVVYQDVFKIHQIGCENVIKDIKTDVTEIKADLKELIKHSRQRRLDDYGQRAGNE